MSLQSCGKISKLYIFLQRAATIFQTLIIVMDIYDYNGAYIIYMHSRTLLYTDYLVDILLASD